LNALEKKGDSKTLANPSLLVLDGEKSFILSGSKYVYPQIQSKDSSGAPIYTIQTEKVGVYLQVGVQVGLDDDMVLSIYPQVTDIASFQEINGGNYPIIDTNEEQATVRANKGDVIVLGGLKDSLSSYSNPSVPFLSNIPLLGRLFSSPDKVRGDKELMIFLTPEIVEDVQPPLDIKFEAHAAPAPAPAKPKADPQPEADVDPE
jgi:type II secretory pathway component GspD/PulD (secretin)